MLRTASSRKGIVIEHQSSRRAFPAPPLSFQSSKTSSTLAQRHPTVDGFQRFHRPLTTSKSKDEDRVKELETVYLLSEQELNDFYHAFCFMARKKGLFVSSFGKSNARRSKTVEIQKSFRPWECKTEATVTLSLFDFFAAFNLVNGGFYDAIFELVGMKGFHSMIFSEFLDGVLSFSFFTNDDMIKFVFFVLDKNKEGKISRFQLLRLLESLHCKKIVTFQRALLPSTTESSSIDCAAVKRLFANYPSMLEPAYRLQNVMRRRIMGDKFWRRKQMQIAGIKKVREFCNRSQEEKSLLSEWRGTIGLWFSHYFKRESCYRMTKVQF